MIYLIVIVMCYTFVALLKKTKVPNEALPIISATIGAVLTAIAYYWLPEIVPSTSMGEALVVGVLSGLAATGSNQVYKQAIKYFKNKYGVDVPILSDEETEE